MNELRENLANLLKVKTLLTLIVAAVWGYLAVTGYIPPDKTQDVFFVVISFFFGAQYGKYENRKKDKK